MNLSSEVDPAEANLLAKTAIEHGAIMARDFRAVRPPWLHNVMVNYGLRERGLCFHWANDLFKRLYLLRCKSLEVRLVVSGMDTRHEHNAVLITASAQGPETGLVLDAWRNSGRLWFGRIGEDRYQWGLLPDDRVNPELRELLSEQQTGSGLQ